MGGVVFGGTIGAVACGFLGFAVVALSGGGWSLLFEMMGILLGGLGGAIAPLVAGTDRTGPGRWPASLLGRAILWGIVASLVLGALGGGMLAGRDPVTQTSGIAYLVLCGSTAPLVAWADRAKPGRSRALLRGWILAFGPLLLGVAVLVWRFGLIVLNSSSRYPVGPKATASAAPPAPAFRPSTWWDVAAGNMAAAIAPIVKATHDAVGGALVFLLGFGLPIAFIAYRAFLGGRALRVFPKQAGAEVSPRRTALNDNASR